MLADHAAQQLLDFNQKLDINLLDNVVNCLYHGVGPQVCCEVFALMHVTQCSCACIKQCDPGKINIFPQTNMNKAQLMFCLLACNNSKGQVIFCFFFYSKEWHRKC